MSGASAFARPASPVTLTGQLLRFLIRCIDWHLGR
jgi:hypothetical protein